MAMAAASSTSAVLPSRFSVEDAWQRVHASVSCSSISGVSIKKMRCAPRGQQSLTVFCVAAPTKIDQQQSQVSESKEANSSLPASSTFMTEVTNLIKLVDSKDIVELELKHKDFELVVRKTEALAPAQPAAATPAPSYSAFPPYFPPMQAPSAPPPSAPASPAPASTPDSTPSAPALPAAPQYPAMLSPMAGNFYRSPAPGEPAFLKVGDKVRKGQVLCIIEAMKLMNEIESDQDGTIVEIVAEDGKPVTTDSPLFIIKP